MATFIRSRKDMVDSASQSERFRYQAASGEQRQKSKSDDQGEEGGDSGEGSQKLAKNGEELKEDMDSLMDEIDSVLEENAEEFVKNYVQRGGE